jgi:hypothetical protein
LIRFFLRRTFLPRRYIYHETKGKRTGVFFASICGTFPQIWQPGKRFLPCDDVI